MKSHQSSISSAVREMFLRWIELRFVLTAMDQLGRKWITSILSHLEEWDYEIPLIQYLFSGEYNVFIWIELRFVLTAVDQPGPKWLHQY